MIFEKIKELCDKEGLSVRQLEISLGLGSGSIGKWKSGNPRVDNLKLVADHFNVPIEFFLEE